MINCFKDSIHVLMSVLLSTNNDDDDHDAYEEIIDHVNGHGNEVREEEENEGQTGGDTLTLKSSLRKADSFSTEAAETKEKKKVQWVDLMGKELAEIRVFEPSEEDDINPERGKTCVCVIL